MRIAITGGTGFVGGHLAETLSQLGHEAVILARGVDHRPWAQEVLALPGVTSIRLGIGDEVGLRAAFAGCDAVAHCAGINRELGSQTYESVHVRGTANVVRAAEASGVRRIAITSFLRARPNCGSPYHESKWAAEELVRSSSCEWTVLKPGMIFGRGDHMLDHLSHALYTFPIYLGVGHCRVRPLAVSDVSKVLVAALVEGQLVNKTVGLVGSTEIEFDDAARLVASVLGVRRLFVSVPVQFHSLLSIVSERAMDVPLIAKAQVQILKEEVIEPCLAPDELPEDLVPTTPFNEESIRQGLPEAGRFGLHDLRWFSETPKHVQTGSLLIFDGDCGFCTTVAGWTARRFRHDERAEAWQHLDAEVLEHHGLSQRDVQDAAWWVDDSGLRERGHRAVGQALHADGGLFKVLSLLILNPPTSWIASVIYKLVVRWRYKLPGGTPACRVAGRTSKG